MSVLIAPSILAADFACLADEVQRVAAGGADLLHVDVMDGHFVPNLTMGIPVVEALRRVSPLPIDAHLMIENPERHVEAFARAGTTMIAVHAEVCPQLTDIVNRVRAAGARPSVAINPETPIDRLEEVAHLIDAVIVMSVHPGFTGQAFLPGSIARITAVRDMLAAHRSNALIEVDGGVGLSNANAIVRAGATAIVAGAAIFHATDSAAACRALRAAADAS